MKNLMIVEGADMISDGDLLSPSWRGSRLLGEAGSYGVSCHENDANYIGNEPKSPSYFLLYSVLEATVSVSDS